jgi:transcriptional regulator with XRE-family HTH domain
MEDESESDIPDGPIRINVSTLRLAVRAANMSQAEFARRTGLSAGYVSHLLDPKTPSGVYQRTMARILAAFPKLTFADLVELGPDERRAPR